MTHEERLALAIQFNKAIVAGKKAGQIATADLIRQDNISENDLSELVYIYPKWQAGISVLAGDLYRHNDTLFEAIQPHTTQSDWTPDATPALWESKAPAGVIPEWVQPTGGHDAYNIGDKVIFEGKTYESTINDNVWSPTGYPQGWKVI